MVDLKKGESGLHGKMLQIKNLFKKSLFHFLPCKQQVSDFFFFEIKIYCPKCVPYKMNPFEIIFYSSY